MKFMLRSATMVSVLALGVVGAHAADLTYEPVPVAPAPFNWTGFYIGVHGGVGGANVDSNFSNPDFSANWSDTAFGAFGGAQIGYNYQFAPNWVVGAETDIAASGIKASFDYNEPGFDQSIEAKVDWFGTIRGRLGYAWDELLLYGTGGAAYGNLKAKAHFSDAPDLDFDVSDTQWGWTIGAGVEYAITPNITLKTEYLYVDLGSVDLNGYNVVVDAVGDTSVDAAFHTVKFGLNYKF